jgi:hypothetical protein
LVLGSWFLVLGSWFFVLGVRTVAVDFGWREWAESGCERRWAFPNHKRSEWFVPLKTPLPISPLAASFQPKIANWKLHIASWFMAMAALVFLNGSLRGAEPVVTGPDPQAVMGNGFSI